MNIYLTNDWLSFPQTEYGGLIVWASEDEESIIAEVIHNCLDEVDIKNMMEYLTKKELKEIQDNQEATDRFIRKRVIEQLNVRRVGTALPNQEFGIIEQFST